MQKINFLLLLTIVICFESIAQNKRLITGSVVDLEDGTALPFASISLKKHLIGTITNENGEFEFLIPENIVDDTLIVSYLCYQDQKFFVGAIKNQLSIKLQANSIVLQEVVVRPMPPTHYIKLSVNKFGENYPNAPFTTEAYFSEKIIENNMFIKHNEAVFKTYYPAYQDTTPNQNQLLLYREEKKVHEVAFMREKINKEKKRKKENAIKKGQEHTEDEDKGMIINVEGMFGGPKLILKIGKTRSTEPYLDSTNFKKFHYSFSEKSTAELMVIKFEAKKVIDHIKLNGNIFIDMRTDAIVAVEYHGTIRISLANKAILFLLGASIDNPNMSMKKSYRQIKDKWYPENIQLLLNVIITKKHMFEENEHSDFEFKQVFSVNKIEVDNSTPIPLEKRFKSKNGFETQIYNDNGLSWPEINIMKKQ